MFYREAGQYKTSYAADMAVFPLRQDRIGLALIVAAAYALSFSNDFMLQAVLIIGGFSSIPGAIVGGLIIGVGEKIGEFYWGPLVGGGIETWLAYVIALLFLLYRPQGLFGEKIIERV